MNALLFATLPTWWTFPASSRLSYCTLFRWTVLCCVVCGFAWPRWTSCGVAAWRRTLWLCRTLETLRIPDWVEVLRVVPLASPSVGRVVRAQPWSFRIPFIYTANSSLQPPPSSPVMCSPIADSRTVYRAWTCGCALVFSRTQLWHLRVLVHPNFCGACVHIQLLILYKVTLIYW